jgi:SAM-dependent methyltransferase
MGVGKFVPSGDYTKEFYDLMRDGSRRSAEIILPLVLRVLPVRSVVDVGCGDGNWLAVSRRLGVEEIVGIDGEYVDRSVLQIPQDCFRAFDLTKPLHLERAFDLALSLEVAEHLPEDCATIFVESLTRAAPCVLFSAAIPFQGGTNHVNEQWPDKWAELFGERGYFPVDLIRGRVWQNGAVDWWYAQNTLLFARKSLIASNKALQDGFERTNLNQLSLVHPRQFLYLQGLRAEQSYQPSGLKEASRLLLVCLRNSVKSRLNSVVRRGPDSKLE